MGYNHGHKTPLTLSLTDDDGVTIGSWSTESEVYRDEVFEPLARALLNVAQTEFSRDTIEVALLGYEARG